MNKVRMILALACAGALSASAAKPLNFVWIVADDLGYGDTGFNGSTQIPTPHIDRIATGGVVMECGYVSAPVCGPSRAGFHTGRYQHRFGHEGNVGRSGGGTPTDVPMIQEELKRLGYHTGLVGKWHDGKAPKYWPYSRGFDEFFGFSNGASRYWIRDNEKKALFRDRQPVEHEDEYLTDAFGREAVSFIKRNKEKPFFLEVAFNAPHAPISAKDDDLARFAELGQRQKIAAMIHCMDVNVGRILDAIEAAGVSERTMVVFFSDNGGKLMHGGSNGHLHGEKTQTYEGGVRVPFAVKLPGTISPGSRSDIPIISLDLFPTTLLLAGGTVDPNWPLDGVDIIDVLSGRSRKRPHREFFWRSGYVWALRQGDWKILRGTRGDDVALYDLANDQNEANNLTSRFPERAAVLKERWLKVSTSLGPAGWGAFKDRVARD